MAEASEYSQYPAANPISKIRDVEERQRLLKDRILLLGQTHIEEREKTFTDLQELKKAVIQIKEENIRIKELLQRITEQINKTARKEELAILQRQFNLFRK
jgi:hypothetical protein